MDDREIRRIFRDLESRFGEVQKSLGKLNGKFNAPAFFIPCLVQVYTTYHEAGGSGGKYVVLIVNYSLSTAKIAGNLALPEGLLLPATDEEALGLNLAEDGLSSHWIDTTGSRSIYTTGLYVGRTAKSGSTPDGRPIIVFREGPPADFFRVDLSSTGGSNGNGTAEPSYVYTVTRRGTSLGTGKSPEVGRSKGYFDAATVGVGYYDSTGAFQLFRAYEKEGTVECT